MASSVYTINKGINKPVEFRGLKAQYIWYLAGGLLVLLFLFAILYITGVNTFGCLGIIVLLGAGLFLYVYRLSRIYGEHGLMKKVAARAVPRLVKTRGRKIFMNLKAKR